MTPPLRVLGVRVSGTRRAESGRVSSDKMALDIGLGSHGGSWLCHDRGAGIEGGPHARHCVSVTLLKSRKRQPRRRLIAPG